MSKTETTEELLRLSIAASDRTTRAVRALVRFVFIQFGSGSVAAVCIAVGVIRNDVYWMAGAGAIVLGGLIWSIFVGYDELDMSDPKRPLNR